MQLDPAADKAMAATLRRPAPSRPAIRQPWLRLLSSVMALAGPQAAMLRHQDRPWASVTFSGSRHTIALQFTGEEGAAAAEAFIEALPDHEFDLARQLVADAAVLTVDHTMLPEPRIAVEVELLLLDHQ